jgi:hypothetical protein
MSSVEILTLVIIPSVIIVALIAGWRITWLATRVDRAQARAERTWAVLDAALVRRAERALPVSTRPPHCWYRMRPAPPSSPTCLGVTGKAPKATSATSLTRSVLCFPAAPTNLNRSEPEPVSAADCTTMRWPPLCRYAAATPYECCDWQAVQPSRVRSKWPMDQSAL